MRTAGTVQVKHMHMTSTDIIEDQQWTEARYVIQCNDDSHIHELLNRVCVTGHLPVVRYLIEHGADIHADNNRALRKSAKHGHVLVVQYLVEHGADIHADDDYALRVSMALQHDAMVQYLLTQGATHPLHAPLYTNLSWSAIGHAPGPWWNRPVAIILPATNVPPSTQVQNGTCSI